MKSFGLDSFSCLLDSFLYHITDEVEIIRMHFRTY